MMSWIQTHNRNRVNFLEPQEDSILLSDIATSLSRINRFLGHTILPYSVAQHCVIASRLPLREGRQLVEQDMSPYEVARARLCVLMHDASEAYVGDMPKPLKDLLPQYKEIEKRISAAIYRKFEIVEDMEKYKGIIQQADIDMLAWEADYLLPGGRLEGWGEMDSNLIDNEVNICLRSDKRTLTHFWPSGKAEEVFRSQYWNLSRVARAAKVKEDHDE